MALLNKNNLKVKLADGLTEIGMSQVKAEASGLKLEDIYNVATLKKEDFMQSCEAGDNVYYISSEFEADGIRFILSNYAEGTYSGLTSIKFKIDTKDKSYILSNTCLEGIDDNVYFPLYTGFVFELASENGATLNFKFGNYILIMFVNVDSTMEEGYPYAYCAMNTLTLNGEQIAEGNDVFDYIESISMLY